MRSNSSESEVGSHWNSNATTVSTAAMTRPVATSWTMPLRTASETTPSSDGGARSSDGRGVAELPANVAAVRRALGMALWSLVPALLTAVVVVASTRGASGQQRPVLLAFAGDVHFEGAVRTTLVSRSGQVLGAIAPVLNEADIAAVNLETAVTTGGAPQSKQYVFRAPPSAFAALRNGGVDVATIHGERIAIIAATQVLDDNLISAWTAGPRKPGLASAKDVPRLLEAVRAG